MFVNVNVNDDDYDDYNDYYNDRDKKSNKQVGQESEWTICSYTRRRFN